MQLNLPSYEFKIEGGAGHSLIFDVLRRKWVKLTPEEWVRQHFLRYLTEEKHFPASRIAVEYSLKINRKHFRADAVVFSDGGKPLLVVECKAPSVAILPATFDQIARYNYTFQSEYLIVTNGMVHYGCLITREPLGYEFLKEIPDYRDIAR